MIYKEFAKRLETACEGNPHCPTEQYRGKQKWIKDGLESEFGVEEIANEARRRGVQQGVLIEEAWALYKDKSGI